MNPALKLLTDDCTVASVACRAIEKELGMAWKLWEPETLWKELHHRGVDVPLGNRQQIMAGRAVLNTGRVFYDGLVFDRTSAAFSNDLCDYEGFDDAVVAHHAWCIDEVRAISDFHEDPVVEYDREVVGIVVRSLREEGFVIAPTELEFAQSALDRTWGKSGAELKKDVLAIWASAKGLSVRNIPYPETPRGVQMARLASVEAFLTERRATRVKQLAELAQS